MLRNRSTCLLLLGLSLGACADDGPLPLSHPLVLVYQKPVPTLGARPCPACDLLPGPVSGAIYSLFNNFASQQPEIFQPIGSYLVRLDPDGTQRTLTPVLGAGVRDPEVSWDGRRILFSMKRGVHGRWQIHEVDADGSNLRRISRDDRYNDLDPAYLPDGRIVFVSDRPKRTDPVFQLPSAQLHLMQPDGSGVVQLSADPGGEFNPTVSADGRLLFTRWSAHYPRLFLEQGDEPLGPFAFVDRFLVWKVALDGTSDAHPVFGEHTIHDGAGGYTHVREAADGRLVATLADAYNTFGSGTVVALDPAQHADAQRYEPLTPDVHGRFDESVRGRYRSPYPLQDGRVVAVHAGGPVQELIGCPIGVLCIEPAGAPSGPRRQKPPHFELVLLPETPGAPPELLLEVDDLWMFSPVELVPRTPPAPVPGTARPGFEYGVLNARDVELRNRNAGRVVHGDDQPQPLPGEVHAVEIFRVDFVQAGLPHDPELQVPVERLLGHAPVETDGSFAAVVPAGVPLFWRTVRADGSSVVQDPFLTELRPGQVLTCNGCHSPHDGRQGRTTNLALRNPVNLAGTEVDRNGNGTVDLLE